MSVWISETFARKFCLATCEKMAHDPILAEVHNAASEDALPVFTSWIDAESAPYLLQPSRLMYMPMKT